jgi:farnesyl-diphosphate farnesyltransferase
VADTRALPRPERLAHLETLRARYAGTPADLGAVGRAAAAHQAADVERRLLESIEEATGRVDALDRDRDDVRRVLATITAGMILDLERFPGEDAAGLTALPTLEELDRYTYLVAGCVGEFWTALHVRHRPRLGRFEAAGLDVRFGKALQMTNILRDVPTDLRSGRCYLPAAELAGLGLRPLDLLDPVAAVRVRPLVERLLRSTLEHYDAAWRYTLAIPAAEWRMRLACAWPLMIGLATLRALAARPDPLAASAPVKIPRSAVRGIIARSTVSVWSNRMLAADAARLRRRIAL